MTRFAILRDHLSNSRQIDPPIGALLVLTLVIYGCLCIYCMTQL